MRSWSSHRPLGFLLILHFLGIIQEAFQWPLHYPLKGEKLPKETYEKQEKEFQGKFEDAFKNGAERLRTIEAYRDNFSKLLVQTMSKNSQFKVNHLEKWMNKLKEFLKKLEVVDDAQIKEDPLKTWFSRLETDLTEEKGKAHDHDFIKNGYEPVIYFSNDTFTEEMMNALMGQEFWSKGRNFYLASVHSVFDTIEMCIEEASCIEKEKGKTEDSRNYAMVRANKVRMKVLLAMVFQMLDSNMENKPTGEGEDKTKEEGKDTEDDKAADSQNHSTTKGQFSCLKVMQVT